MTLSANLANALGMAVMFAVVEASGGVHSPGCLSSELWRGYRRWRLWVCCSPTLWYARCAMNLVDLQYQVTDHIAESRSIARPRATPTASR